MLDFIYGYYENNYMVNILGLHSFNVGGLIMARFNQTRKRTQRYLLRAVTIKLLKNGIKPLFDCQGKPYFVIGGRHYNLPKSLI